MRIFARISAVLVVLIMTVLAALPYVKNWNQYKQPLIEYTENLLGRSVTIDGKIALHIFPKPALIMENVRLANIKGAPSDYMMSAHAVSVRLAWLPLIWGSLEAKGYDIYNGQINLETTSDGKANWEFPSQQIEIEALQAKLIKLHQVNISYHHKEFEINHTFYKMNATAQLSYHQSGIQLDMIEGELPFASDAIQFKGHREKEGEQKKIVLNIQSKQFIFSSVGSLSAPGSEQLFQGEMEVQISHPTALTQYITAENFDEQAMRFTNPVTVKGPAIITRKGLFCEALQVVSNKLDSNAKLQVLFGKPAQLTIDWDIDHGDLTPFIESLRASIGAIIAPRTHLSPVAAYVSDVVHDMVEHLSELMDIKWTIQAKKMSYNEQDIKDVLLGIEVKNGALQIQPFKAQLPYDAQIALNGAIISHGTRPLFQGKIDFTGSNLGAFLQWAGVQINTTQTTESAQDKALSSPGSKFSTSMLKQFSYESELTLTANEIRISHLQALINAFEVSGEWVIKRGKVPMVNATLTVENLDMDSYSLTAPLQQLLSDYIPSGDSFKKESYHWLTTLPFEADIEINADELTMQGKTIENIDLAFRAAQGMLTINPISILAKNFNASMKMMLDLRGYSPILNMEIYGKRFDTAFLQQLMPASIKVVAEHTPANIPAWSKEPFIYPALYLTDGMLAVNLEEMNTSSGSLQNLIFEGRFNNRNFELASLQCKLAFGDLQAKGLVQFRPLRTQLAFGLFNARIKQLIPKFSPTSEMDGYASASGTASFGGETPYDIINTLQLSASFAIRHLLNRGFDFDNFIASIEDRKFTTPDKVNEVALQWQNLTAPATIYNMDGNLVSNEGGIALQNAVFDSRRIKANLAGRINLKELTLDLYSKVAYTDSYTSTPIQFDFNISGPTSSPVLTLQLDHVAKAVTERVERAAAASKNPEIHNQVPMQPQPMNSNQPRTGGPPQPFGNVMPPAF